jgi:glycine betaine/proline transport system substrate-binding protein
MRTFKNLFGKSLAIAALALGLSSAMAADKPTLTLGYVNGWADSVATTHVAAEVLQSQLGYEVKLKPVEAAIMWQGVARGDLDAALSAWLPATHGDYYDKLKDKVNLIGTNYTGAKIGLIVPDYVDVQSIADLNQHKKAFQGQITGIDAGAGIMIRTEEAIKAYDLDFNLMASSGPAMTIALARAEKQQKPIVVTGWIPHWMFAKWDLRFLEDPQQVFGEAETVYTVANPGLETKAAEAAGFLKNFAWTDKEIGAVMLAIDNGETPKKAASAWVAENPERVAEWLN